MHIALFGATGGTGREVIKQAIAAGHEVTALVRDSAKIKNKEDNLYLVVGDVLDMHKVEETLAATDAVICTLGSTSNNPDNVVSQGTENIIEAMQKQGLSRLVVISSMGVGDSIDQVSRSFKMLTKTVLRKAIEDKERQEDAVRASDLEWVILRPSGLTNGAATGEYQLGTDPSIEASQISRADVAACALNQLTDDTFVGNTPSITY